MNELGFHMSCTKSMLSITQLADWTQITEVTMYMKDVCASFQLHSDFFKKELYLLSLQILCACEVSLKITGDCSTLMNMLEQNLDLLKDVSQNHFVSFLFICHFYNSGVCFSTAVIAIVPFGLHTIVYHILPLFSLLEFSNRADFSWAQSAFTTGSYQSAKTDDETR